MASASGRQSVGQRGSVVPSVTTVAATAPFAFAAVAVMLVPSLVVAAVVVMHLRIARHIALLVPGVLDEVHGCAASTVPMSMLAPAAGMHGRQAQLDRLRDQAAGHRRRNLPRLDGRREE